MMKNRVELIINTISDEVTATVTAFCLTDGIPACGNEVGIVNSLIVYRRPCILPEAAIVHT